MTKVRISTSPVQWLALKGAHEIGRWLYSYEKDQALAWRIRYERGIMGEARIHRSSSGNTIQYESSKGLFLVQGEYSVPAVVPIADVILQNELQQMFEPLAGIITSEVYETLMQRVQAVSSGYFLESSLVPVRSGNSLGAGVHDIVWVADVNEFRSFITLFRTYFVLGRKKSVLFHELLHKLSTTVRGNIMKSGVDVSYTDRSVAIGVPRNEEVTRLIQEALLLGDIQALTPHKDIVNAYFSSDATDVLNILELLNKVDL